MDGDSKEALANMKMALANMKVGGMANKNMWENMYASAKTCLNEKEWKDLTDQSEMQDVLDTVPEKDIKRSKSGKVFVNEHLTSTYKQYKSRLTTIFKIGRMADLSHEPTATKAQELIKEAKNSAPRTAQSIVGNYIIAKVDVDPSYTGSDGIKINLNQGENIGYFHEVGNEDLAKAVNALRMYGSDVPIVDVIAVGYDVDNDAEAV